jgi:hypothetical protein
LQVCNDHHCPNIAQIIRYICKEGKPVMENKTVTFSSLL